jgi:hypothetical protein
MEENKGIHAQGPEVRRETSDREAASCEQGGVKTESAWLSSMQERPSVSRLRGEKK